MGRGSAHALPSRTALPQSEGCTVRDDGVPLSPLVGRAVSDGGSFSSTEVQRAFSFLIYLNSDWAESDGGALRIFEPLSNKYARTTRLAGVYRDHRSQGTRDDLDDRSLDDSGIEAQLAGEAHFDVLPEAGKLVIFDSCTVDHEVRETMRSRQCVVGWFRRVRHRGDTRVPTAVSL